MDELKSRYRTTIIICAVQILTVITLTVTSWFNLFNFEPITSPSTITTLWIVVIFIAVGSFILRRVFFKWEKLTDTFLLKGKKGLMSRLQSNTVILSALAETIAILGFIITSLSGDKFQMLRAAAISLIVFLISFPRLSVWEKIVGTLEKLDIQR